MPSDHGTKQSLKTDKLLLLGICRNSHRSGFFLPIHIGPQGFPDKPQRRQGAATFDNGRDIKGQKFFIQIDFNHRRSVFLLTGTFQPYFSRIDVAPLVRAQGSSNNNHASGISWFYIIWMLSRQIHCPNLVAVRVSFDHPDISFFRPHDDIAAVTGRMDIGGPEVFTEGFFPDLFTPGVCPDQQGGASFTKGPSIPDDKEASVRLLQHRDAIVVVIPAQGPFPGHLS